MMGVIGYVSSGYDQMRAFPWDQECPRKPTGHETVCGKASSNLHTTQPLFNA